MTPRPTRAATVGVSLVLAAGITACSDPAPREELDAAIEATLDGDLSYELAVDADERALDTLGEGAGQAAVFLADVAIEGGRTSDGAYGAALSIGGGDALFEVRGGDGPLRLRTGLATLLGLPEGADPSDDLLPRLQTLGVGDQAAQALASTFAGDWVEVSDARSLADLAGAAGVEDTGASDAEAGDDDGDGALDLLDELLEVTEVADEDGARRFEVELDPSDLVGATDGGEVPGTVIVRDGVIDQLRANVEIGDAGGEVDLVLSIEDHGEPADLDDASPAASITVDELRELTEALGGDLG